MFIKIPKLEAVLKKAYKGAGIHIERRGDRLALRTGRLYIEVDIENASKDFKAAVVRYTGDIPPEGFAAVISEDNTQMGLDGTIDLCLIHIDTYQGKLFEQTLFNYVDEKVLQSPVDNQIVTVPLKEWLVYCPEAVEPNEEQPESDFNLYDNLLVTRNETMVLGFLPKEADDILAELTNIGARML